MVDTDAIQYEFGAVLLQEQEIKGDVANDVIEKEWVTIGFWSKTIISAERNYYTTEKECVQVMWDLKTFLPHIEGTQSTVRSDRETLKWMLNMTDTHGRISRWRLSLRF